MPRNRLEGFSDGVIAIIITIMVLELGVPHEPTFAALRPLVPVFVSYVLSFLYVGIYWTNHHHLIHTVSQTNGAILWANLHLLFWLSLIPFTTAWMGENQFAPAPTFLYGLNLILAAIAYQILERTIIRSQGEGSLLEQAVGSDNKSRLSAVLYLVALPIAFFWPYVSLAIYFAVILHWIIPDRRIESLFTSSND